MKEPAKIQTKKSGGQRVVFASFDLALFSNLHPPPYPVRPATQRKNEKEGQFDDRKGGGGLARSKFIRPQENLVWVGGGGGAPLFTPRVLAQFIKLFPIGPYFDQKNRSYGTTA